MSVLDDIVYVPCDPSNHGGTRTKGEIKYLVYHYTANDGDRAINNCMYYKNNVVKASAHYYVDDDCVMQSVPDLVSAWAVGGKKWNDCAETGGGKLFGTVTNRNSISIELCDTKKDGVVMAQPATLDNGIALGKMLMAKYDIPIERVIRHFDVTGKWCPKYFMDDAKWNEYKSRLVEDEMTIEQFVMDVTPQQLEALVDKMTNETCYTMLLKANEHAASLATPEWMKNELDEAVKAGITDGSRPLAMCMRGASAIMAMRAANERGRES